MTRTNVHTPAHAHARLHSHARTSMYHTPVCVRTFTVSHRNISQQQPRCASLITSSRRCSRAGICTLWVLCLGQFTLLLYFLSFLFFCYARLFFFFDTSPLCWCLFCAATPSRLSSSLLRLLSLHSIPCLKDEEGAFFLDRDGDLFKPILNFLRTGLVVSVVCVVWLLVHGYESECHCAWCVVRVVWVQSINHSGLFFFGDVTEGKLGEMPNKGGFKVTKEQKQRNNNLLISVDVFFFSGELYIPAGMNVLQVLKEARFYMIDQLQQVNKNERGRIERCWPGREKEKGRDKQAPTVKRTVCLFPCWIFFMIWQVDPEDGTVSTKTSQNNGAHVYQSYHKILVLNYDGCDR